MRIQMTVLGYWLRSQTQEKGKLEAHMESVKVSKPLLKRLPIYLDHLKNFPGEDLNISATTIARELGLGHVMVRKDLAKVSNGGHRRTGRSRIQLIQDIEQYLELCAPLVDNTGFCEDA